LNVQTRFSDKLEWVERHGRLVLRKAKIDSKTKTVTIFTNAIRANYPADFEAQLAVTIEAARTRALGDGNWDEDEHPRDEDGKFSHSGSGDVSVGTSNEGNNPDHVKMVLNEARSVAKELDFDPTKITIGAQESSDRNFVINGKAFKAAGLAYIHEGPLGGQIKLFPDSLSDPAVVAAVTAHEIQHQKFQHALNIYQVERKMAQDEPGPPPDPNGKYHWQKKGGQDAVFAPDDSLREPYASKYKGYTAMQEALYKHNFRSFAESDGVSEYSFEYWKGWKAGTVNSDVALHETIAEMARFKFMTKEFPDHMGERIISYREDPENKPSKAEIDANAKLWRKLYNTVEKLY
jgi:hypothetical protein